MSDVMQEITAGFFDSVNQDRLYSADQMNMPYKRIVSEGVFSDDETPDFEVSSGTGMIVTVSPGNAIIGGKWAENKEDAAVEIAGNTGSETRIDSIILRCDSNISARNVCIVYRQGTATAPALDTGANIKEFRLANINVPVNATAITGTNIIDTRGSAECPWVSGVIPPTQAQTAAAVAQFFTDNPGIFVIDDELSGTSVHAVQNKVVTAVLNALTANLSVQNARLLSAFPTDTAQGAIASFTDGADSLPLKSLVIGIEPKQDLHGYANPWPAGGSKNKAMPLAFVTQGLNLNKFSSDDVITPIDNGFKYTFSASTRGISFYLGYYTAGTVVTVSLDNSGSGLYRILRTSSIPEGSAQVAATSVVQPGDNSDHIEYTFTADADGYFWAAMYKSGHTSPVICTNIQAELGSSATSYVPYSNICPISGWTGAEVTANGSVIPITFPSAAGTVYGGTLNVTNGVLTVDGAIITLDGSSDEQWAVEASGASNQYFRCKIGAYGSVVGDYAVSNQYKQTIISGSTTAVGINVYNSAGYNSAQTAVRPSNVAGMTLATFTAAIGATPLQVCYKLASPTVYQLDPVTVASILGANNIYADTGSASVEYRADPTLYISRKIAEAVSALS